MINQESLRSLAEKKGITIGTCVNFHALENDPEYARIITREFNLITPENALKFRQLCPEEGEYNFEVADRLIDFAEKNNMDVRGHVLVWDDQLPQWLINGNHSKDELTEILNNHISTVVKRYAGKIPVWDVVNEAIDEHGNYNNTFWYKGIGPEYIEFAFHAARNADPAAKLFYNDYGPEGTLEHEHGVYQLIKRLKDKGVPVDGVGFQMHLDIEQINENTIYSDSATRLEDLGIEINITELDVRMQANQEFQSAILSRQAQLYSQVARSYLIPNKCRTIILWGFTDKYSWIPFFYPGEGAATIMTKDYIPKPAYNALREELKQIHC